MIHAQSSGDAAAPATLAVPGDVATPTSESMQQMERAGDETLIRNNSTAPVTTQVAGDATAPSPETQKRMERADDGTLFSESTTTPTTSRISPLNEERTEFDGSCLHR